MNPGRQASPMSCKAAHFFRLEKRLIDNSLPACTRSPHTSAAQSCLLYHGCDQHCVFLPMCSPGLKPVITPSITAFPGTPHILSMYRVKSQTRPLSSLNSWAVCALVLYTLHVSHLPLFLGQNPHFIILLGALCSSIPPVSCGLYNVHITGIISCS